MWHRKNAVVWLMRVTIAVSILLNAIAGGRNNQTLSARMWERKMQDKIHIVPFIDWLFKWEQQQHCYASWIKWTVINSAINHYEDISDYVTKGTKL